MQRISTKRSRTRCQAPTPLLSAGVISAISDAGIYSRKSRLRALLLPTRSTLVQNLGLPDFSDGGTSRIPMSEARPRLRRAIVAPSYLVD